MRLSKMDTTERISKNRCVYLLNARCKHCVSRVQYERLNCAGNTSMRVAENSLNCPSTNNARVFSINQRNMMHTFYLSSFSFDNRNSMLTHKYRTKSKHLWNRQFDERQNKLRNIGKETWSRCCFAGDYFIFSLCCHVALLSICKECFPPPVLTPFRSQSVCLFFG